MTPASLHELAYASGHPSRLDRDLAHPFGSVGYAKEELRAEIASLMVGNELGIGHDPGQHAAYVKSWVQVLKEDPKEILRASRDADKITGYVLVLEKGRMPSNIESLPRSRWRTFNQRRGGRPGSAWWVNASVEGLPSCQTQKLDTDA